MTITPARFPEDNDALIAIWREYVASPQTRLDWQDNDADFANLPDRYAPPDGCVLLARSGDVVTGCIAYRRVDAAICEMKRLYVRPVARGAGLGRRLVEAPIDSARQAAYAEMRLDVLAEFEAAQTLYQDLGFVNAPAVTFNPEPGARFLGLIL